MSYDETMSDEIAFTGNGQEETDIFQFDPEDVPSDIGGNDSATTEDKITDVSDDDELEEKRVPYSRFKRKEEELEERDFMIKNLEERLSSLESNRLESTPIENLDVPTEWVELYGDSDASKRAYKIQLQREAQLQETAVQKALQLFKEEAVQQENQLAYNENIIDENLEDLQGALGKKLSQQTQDDVLSIVDEFSPTGPDGKYISLFPFDKAYEIYQLRNSQAKQKTIQQRNQVADLTGANSNEESESSESHFKRGWDTWREAI